MAYTSPTDINMSVGIGNLFSYLNEVTSFWFSRLLMLGIFILFAVGYFRSKNNEDFIGAFAVGSYACFVIGILFWIIGFLDAWTFGIIIGAMVIASAILLITKNN